MELRDNHVNNLKRTLIRLNVVLTTYQLIMNRTWWMYTLTITITMISQYAPTQYTAPSMNLIVALSA